MNFGGPINSNRQKYSAVPSRHSLVQIQQYKHQYNVWNLFKVIDVIDLVLVSLLLTLNRFETMFWCFHCWLWTTANCKLLQTASGWISSTAIKSMNTLRLRSTVFLNEQKQWCGQHCQPGQNAIEKLKVQWSFFAQKVTFDTLRKTWRAGLRHCVQKHVRRFARFGTIFTI